MSGPRHSEAHCFNENSPRPPVPGEETGSRVSRLRQQSQALTPRRSSLAYTTASVSCDGSAPLGFEPEGSCGGTCMESVSPPACLRWARNLHSLLQDPEGIALFRKYLDQEGRPHAEPLNFWYACEGLKNHHDPNTIHQLVKLIYRRFFLNLQLLVPEDVRKEANRRVKEGRVDGKVFDNVQMEVEHLINETTYPNFLKSEMYLQYVQSYQNPDSGSCTSSGSSREMSVSCGPTLLPTLHEDSEFISSAHTSHSASETPGELRAGELRLTRDVLMATQQTRAMELRPKPEAYAGIYFQAGASPYHVPANRLHAQYSSYNPVSRQDSELQSLSSDARTESDNMSLTDSSVDGMSIGRPRSSKKQYMRQCRAMKESANLNRDPMVHCTVIPRTQRVPRDQTRSLKPEIFAQVLIEKLENVKRARETQEKLDRHLQDGEIIGGDAMKEPLTGGARTLADAIREKLLVEDDSDQAILDQHVSRVWSDLTPLRSPGLASPRPHSPERRRGLLHNYPHQRSYKQKKEKDGSSTFSADSGNIHDFPEGSDLLGAGSMSSLGSHLPKSKSIPSDYAESLNKPDLYPPSHDQRPRRCDISRRSTSSKKSMTELTDSGVSVVSDAPPLVASKDSRLLSWLKESDKKPDSKHGRHGKKYGSRSGSLERSSRETWGVPAQPFVADPGMPPLPQPHTATQLEEARRRLMEEDRARGGSSRQRYPNSGKLSCEPTNLNPSCIQSNQSTLRKSRQDPADFTTVVFSFCDEQLPYMTKIPGRNITLKQFKDCLLKKGSYRYFFKTSCKDLDVKVIQEEITNDSEVLPLWEGKVMAQVKAME
ncbi:axin isoform X1 [Neodiprion virginianus]|uniref:axin isoform X1 n=2 Tax=Neodiprion fabricii TaxID=2872261 RepID=UPI001ED8E571|nr:axin isoform X1 [Neodiprion fabricii]XP_046413292.1 axin isoform X1 [Neodiprion fabricii]XP_046413293.1 axin isoform X1 [Neodiprion fabricii]XP_046413295.1 axin isoform X1 [Neodiprion fabricii]XP_046413296.1 axin isoform X1 [Neodiprion fabricii]XP_046607614.1 axin isoform X1 [Neodiprion virginianus]XP_046607615.1 axin isoform X1 [Neodiprion virginianus]XP_046607616.1 axin isoform X1 [Neodiprion virginianus]XP_046607617.1 axin isoform X1 [Neodiprion virginianus]XP_046607618.1 axin isofor